MPDQTVLAKLITDLMDKIDRHFGEDAQIGDAALVVEIVDETHSSIIIQTNQLRKHALSGLLMTADQMVVQGRNEID